MTIINTQAKTLRFATLLAVLSIVSCVTTLCSNDSVPTCQKTHASTVRRERTRDTQTMREQTCCFKSSRHESSGTTYSDLVGNKKSTSKSFYPNTTYHRLLAPSATRASYMLFLLLFFLRLADNFVNCTSVCENIVTNPNHENYDINTNNLLLSHYDIELFERVHKHADTKRHSETYSSEDQDLGATNSFIRQVFADQELASWPREANLLKRKRDVKVTVLKTDSEQQREIYRIDVAVSSKNMSQTVPNTTTASCEVVSNEDSFCKNSSDSNKTAISWIMKKFPKKDLATFKEELALTKMAAGKYAPPGDSRIYFTEDGKSIFFNIPVVRGVDVGSTFEVIFRNILKVNGKRIEKIIEAVTRTNFKDAKAAEAASMKVLKEKMICKTCFGDFAKKLERLLQAKLDKAFKTLHSDLDIIHGDPTFSNFVISPVMESSSALLDVLFPDKSSNFSKPYVNKSKVAVLNGLVVQSNSSKLVDTLFGSIIVSLYN